MAVQLGKDNAVMIARVGNGRESHALLTGDWCYTSSLNLTRCGLNGTAVEHLASGLPLRVTCRNCRR